MFASLLDAEKGGCFRIGPSGDDYVSKQLYMPGTTRFLLRSWGAPGASETFTDRRRLPDVSEAAARSQRSATRVTWSRCNYPRRAARQYPPEFPGAGHLDRGVKSVPAPASGTNSRCAFSGHNKSSGKLPAASALIAKMPPGSGADSKKLHDFQLDVKPRRAGPD